MFSGHLHKLRQERFVFRFFVAGILVCSSDCRNKLPQERFVCRFFVAGAFRYTYLFCLVPTRSRVRACGLFVRAPLPTPCVMSCRREAYFRRPLIFLWSVRTCSVCAVVIFWIRIHPRILNCLAGGRQKTKKWTHFALFLPLHPGLINCIHGVVTMHARNP